MNAQDLKYNVEQANPESCFFDRKSMKFFGDTMANYGVRQSVVDTYSEDGVEVWELYRKRPVKNGNHKSAYFTKDTFRRVHEKV